MCKLGFFPGFLVQTVLGALVSPCAAWQKPDASRLALLRTVPLYQSTYVILQTRERVTSPSDPRLARLRIGVHAQTPAVSLGRRYRGASVVLYPWETPDRLLEDLIAGAIDVAIVWAPLAGFWALVHDHEERWSMMPLPTVRPPPSDFPSPSTEVTLAPCQTAIRERLESYGVAPAELLAPVSPETIPPSLPTPPEDLKEATRGWQLYHRHCFQCHGMDCIPSGLASDLRQIILHKSYREFVLVVLQGRPDRGMPPFRGFLDLEGVRVIYQYVRARAFGKLAPGRPSEQD